MRAVVDTNVFLSALLHGRGTRPVLASLIARRFRLVTSDTLLDELTDVISRPEWLRALDGSECHELLAIIREAATFVTPTHHVAVCRDPEDNALLDCALAARVDCLVTGDCDLLILDPFHGIRILRPAEFLRRLAI
jgi:putative PIN family toxin of toxin-antitoxin system